MYSTTPKKENGHVTNYRKHSINNDNSNSNDFKGFSGLNPDVTTSPTHDGYDPVDSKHCAVKSLLQNPHAPVLLGP